MCSQECLNFFAQGAFNVIAAPKSVEQRGHVLVAKTVLPESCPIDDIIKSIWLYLLAQLIGWPQLGSRRLPHSSWMIQLGSRAHLWPGSWVDLCLHPFHALCAWILECLSTWLSQNGYGWIIYYIFYIIYYILYNTYDISHIYNVLHVIYYPLYYILYLIYYILYIVCYTLSIRH